MTIEMKERVIFITASIFNLADMAESDVREVVQLVGADAIRELLGMGHLRCEINYEEMGEEICNYIGWDPVLVIPWRRDEDLSRLGLQIAEVIDGASPADEDVADRLFAFLTWEGIGAWLEINDGTGEPM